jgi:S-adenosylmethionine:tRNA ribosyltransferase-isomerase
MSDLKTVLEKLRLKDFDYRLPPGLIAQKPAEQRDQSRLMVVRVSDRTVEHGVFTELPDYLDDGDVLVLNDTRVIKCRLLGVNSSGKPVELLLVRETREGLWEALAKPGRRAKVGERVSLDGGLAQAEVIGLTAHGRRQVAFKSDIAVPELMERAGHVPLPPYIKRPDDEDDISRYQTVYARNEGAVAAPTAGLHFTPRLLDVLEDKGVQLAWVTLHVGPGTFRPVRTDDPRDHKLDPEWFRLEPEQAAVVSEAKRDGRRVVCVGTTVARALETVAIQDQSGHDVWVAQPAEGWTDKYILPPYEFRILDALVTNFHLPRTTLLMLVAALAGRDLILKAYEEAVSSGYRFYSYGDAMLIL